jgi:hypothetical protein
MIEVLKLTLFYSYGKFEILKTANASFVFKANECSLQITRIK